MGQSVSAFSERLLSELDKVEYRRIINSEDLEDVARLRQKAFSAADISQVLGGHPVDELDFDPNTFVFGVYRDETLVSTVRLHHVTQAHPVSTSRSVFPEAIDPLLDAGLSLIDPSRLAADPEVVDEFPALPYLTLRVVAAAFDYFQVDRGLAFVNPRHEAYYRRVFCAYQVVPPQSILKPYRVPAVLLANDIPVALPKIYRRYPVFRSQPFERRMMFAGPEELGTMPLTIRPTARYLQTA